MGEERIMMEVGTEADARGLLQGHTGGRRKAVRGYTSYTSNEYEGPSLRSCRGYVEADRKTETLQARDWEMTTWSLRTDAQGAEINMVEERRRTMMEKVVGNVPEYVLLRQRYSEMRYPLLGS
jgi:hypothetical protein